MGKVQKNASESYDQLTRETNLFSSIEFDDFGDYRCVATAPVISDTDTSDDATITGKDRVVINFSNSLS